MLYIVSTPIGNLGDITLRALEVLQAVDSIICEDTRRALILLSHFQIKKPLLVLNDYNESQNVESIVKRLKSGENFALISDAGTPLISDPGYKLVRECIQQEIQVDSIPGPSSVITALTLSGLPPDKFLFLGYPPEKSGHRIKWLNQINANRHSELDSESQKKGSRNEFGMTITIFVSPHKMERTLHDMKETYGDIEVVLAHELTKIHQSVEKKKISEWLINYKKLKGEYILLFRI